MRKGQGQRAFGRLGSLVIAGLVTSAVVAAIAFAASNGSSGSQANPASNAGVAAVGQVQIGTGPTFPILAYSWGASQSGFVGTPGGGGGAGKANLQDISFTRLTDATTVELLKKLVKGEHYPTVTVTVTESGTSATFEYKLENVFVSSLSLGGSGGEKAGHTENVTLAFGKVTWTYTDAAGIPTAGSWNLATNTTG